MDGTFLIVSLVFPTEDAVLCEGDFLVPSGGFSKTTFLTGHEIKLIALKASLCSAVTLTAECGGW